MKICVALWIGLALAACGARHVQVAPARPVVAQEQPSASASADAAPPPVVDEEAEYKAALAQGKESSTAMIDSLTTFIAAHPGSRFVPDAYLALGDIAVGRPPYDPGKLAYAKAYYIRAAGHESATFKLARVHWILGELEDGLVAFNRVNYVSSNVTTFRDQALAELPALFAGDYKPTEASAFFHRLHGDAPMLTRLLEQLAQAYDRLAKYPETMAIYDELRRQDPVRICRWNVLYRHARPAANPATLDAHLAKCP